MYPNGYFKARVVVSYPDSIVWEDVKKVIVQSTEKTYKTKNPTEAKASTGFLYQHGAEGAEKGRVDIFSPLVCPAARYCPVSTYCSRMTVVCTSYHGF